jgi:hypothetical protein
MSVKRMDRLNQPPQIPKGVEGTLKFNSEQKNRRDGGDLMEGVKGLSICRDERPSPHRAVPSGEQPERSQIPIHAHASPPTTRSREQSSSRTGAAARPQPITLASTTPSTAGRTYAGSKPDSLVVKKGGGREAGKKAGVEKVGAKASKPTGKDVKKRTRASKECWGRCTLRIIINDWNAANYGYNWSLFLDCEDGQNVHMQIAPGPGHPHYQEIRNIPEPDQDGLVKDKFVTEIEQIGRELLVHCVRYMVPMPPHNHIHPTRLWVLHALNRLREQQIIAVNVADVMAAADA